MTMQRVLVAVDHSPSAAAAVEAAGHLVAGRPARITLLNVVHCYGSTRRRSPGTFSNGTPHRCRPARLGGRGRPRPGGDRLAGTWPGQLPAAGQHQHGPRRTRPHAGAGDPANDGRFRPRWARGNGA